MFKKLIEVDLRRDLKKLQKEDSSVTLNSAKRDHYQFGKILNWCFLAYSQTHFYKALCQMSNHPDCYGHIQDAAYWGSHDPHFILPAAVMFLNFALLQSSSHPFLVNMRQHWAPFSKAVFLLYGSGLAMVLPQTYLISYMAFGLTHLAASHIMRLS